MRKRNANGDIVFTKSAKIVIRGWLEKIKEEELNDKED